MEKCTSAATPFRLWSHNFKITVSPWASAGLEKIETFRTLKSKLCVQSNSFHLLPSLPSLSKMASSSSVSVSQLQALQATVDAMRADVLALTTRLDAALGNTIVEAEKKKPGRKPKAVADEAPVAEDKKSKKKREPKAKATCPTPTDGVVRFAGCADKNEYKVFNNMYRKPFSVEGTEFPSVQHFMAHQRYATTDADYAAKILTQKNPALLTGMLKSKDHVARADWGAVQTSLLTKALIAKFADAELRALLQKTGTATIEFESATDGILGIGADGKGSNILGKTLMAIRTL